MKNIVKFGILSLSLACCFANVACNADNTEVNGRIILDRDSNGNYVFNASLEEGNATRTIRQDNGSVYWEKNENIKIFYDSQTSGTFTSTNQSVSATASFSGKFNNLVSDNDISTNGIIALYPAQEAEYNDGKVIFTVPSQQEAVVDTFKKDLFPAMAKSKSSSLSFYNVCGGIKLSVYYEGIKSITLKGNNSEYLAGRISASFSASGVPEYTVVDGVSEITLVAPQNGYFEVGKMYYIVALPVTLLNGFTITYHTDSDDAPVKINNTVTIHRSKFGLVLNKDLNGFVVKFADPSFKASVVDQYDDNFDGEIDFIEAENVTNINCSNKNITSLDGIEHFTNLRTLNCANNNIKEINLNSMSQLTTLSCSNNPIESLIVDGCSSLATLSIVNASINSISGKKVIIDGYEKSSKFVFSANGIPFTDFSFTNSNSIEGLEIYGDFTKSFNVYNVINVSELEVGHINVEVLDLHNLSISSLDLTNNTNLKELYVYNTKLEILNLSKNTLLTKLNLSDNQLKSINLRYNTLLTELFINNNSAISTLNIDNNLSLKTIEAEGLSISTIDMSQHKSLTDVKLRNNPYLTSMTVWPAATKKNDYILFDMANVIVTDINGNNYGAPYTVGQYVPWFNGGVVYRVDEDGGGMLMNLRDLPFYYWFDGDVSGYYSSYFYFTGKADEPWIPEMFYGNSETDGEYNHKVVYDYYGNYDKFAGYSTCAELSKDGRWYLPAIEELIDLLNRTLGVVNTALYNKGGDRMYGGSSSTITSQANGHVKCAELKYNSSTGSYELVTGDMYVIPAPKGSGSLSGSLHFTHGRAVRKF